jgi:23S rRNA (guanine745-N1)-methyltransferase
MLTPTEKSAWPLICPVCEMVLANTGRTLRCSNRHSFDVAKEGYTNLLLDHGPRARVCGDVPAMVKARRSFLSAGFYSPLSDLLNRCVAQQLGQAEILRTEAQFTCIIEVGCGEGYYLSQLKGCLEPRPPVWPIRYFGMDISKAAVKLAAKQHRGINFVVADVKRKIPFASRSAAVLLNIFSPRQVTEFERVLARKGSCLVVIPGPEHLSSLRLEFGLLEIEVSKLERVTEQMRGVFELAQQRALEYDLRLGGEALLQLIHMTPNYWHMSDEVSSRLLATTGLETKASFTILEFRHRADN